MPREEQAKRREGVPTGADGPSAHPAKGHEPNYKDLVESAADTIYTLDLEGRFTYYNAIAWQQLGHQPGEYLGRHFMEVLTPETAKVALEDFRQRVEGTEGMPFFEVEAVRRDGSTLQLEVRTSGLYHNGQLVGIQGIARDISELKRLQTEVARNAERIALLEERNRIVRELYSSIAQVVFKTSGGPNGADGLLSELRSSLVTDLAKSLSLSDVDLSIIDRIARGLSNGEIGEEVCLSPNTVKDHVRKIMNRLNVRRRAELVAEAARLGLV